MINASYIQAWPAHKIPIIMFLLPSSAAHHQHYYSPLLEIQIESILFLIIIIIIIVLFLSMHNNFSLSFFIMILFFRFLCCTFTRYARSKWFEKMVFSTKNSEQSSVRLHVHDLTNFLVVWYTIHGLTTTGMMK